MLVEGLPVHYQLLLLPPVFAAAAVQGNHQQGMVGVEGAHVHYQLLLLLLGFAAVQGNHLVAAAGAGELPLVPCAQQ